MEPGRDIGVADIRAGQIPGRRRGARWRLYGRGESESGVSRRWLYGGWESRPGQSGGIRGWWIGRGRWLRRWSLERDGADRSDVDHQVDSAGILHALGPTHVEPFVVNLALLAIAFASNFN
jgi:hypothetical protein